MATKLYYIDGQAGIKEFTLSDEEAGKDALVLPGLVVNPVPRRALFDSLEAACAAQLDLVDTQIETVQALLDELTQARAALLAQGVSVTVITPNVTSVHGVDQRTVAALRKSSNVREPKRT